MFIDISEETDVLPDVSALRFLSDTATEQPRASSSQGQGFASLWSKYDQKGSEREEVKWPKTTVTTVYNFTVQHVHPFLSSQISQVVKLTIQTTERVSSPKKRERVLWLGCSKGEIS